MLAGTTAPASSDAHAWTGVYPSAAHCDMRGAADGAEALCAAFELAWDQMTTHAGYMSPGLGEGSGN